MWGTSGSSRRASTIARSAGALCRGASSVSPPSSRSTSWSIRTGSRKRAPPWTTRCATASTSSGTASRDSTGSVPPSSATAESFRLVEPALTTRMAPTQRSVRPSPVADVRVVVPVLPRPGPVPEPFVLHLLAQVAGTVSELRYAVDHIDHEVEPIEIVEHHHVERRRRRALLLVPPHVQVVVVRGPVGETVDQPRVAVVGEYDRPVGGEESVELPVGEPVGVLGLGLKPHQVDDVHDPNFELRQPLAQDRRRGKRLERRAVPAEAEHDVRLVPVVVGR